MAHHLYLFEMIGYSNHGPIKVGITKNIAQRRRQLNGGWTPFGIGYFEFDTREPAYFAEQKIICNFPAAFGREYLRATAEEVAAYAKSVCAPRLMVELEP